MQSSGLMKSLQTDQMIVVRIVRIVGVAFLPDGEIRPRGRVPKIAILHFDQFFATGAAYALQIATRHIMERSS